MGVLIAKTQLDSMETTTKAFENIGTKVEEMIKGMTLLSTELIKPNNLVNKF
jgi:hypothetical protein